MKKLFDLCVFSISFPEARKWIPLYLRLTKGCPDDADLKKAKNIVFALKLQANAACFAMIGIGHRDLDMIKK